LQGEPGDLLLLVADARPVVWAVLGTLRNDLLRPPVNEGPYCYLWVTEFPLFEGLDDEGRPIAAHHPFTMPYAEDLDLLEGDPLEVRSQAYDLVLNGWELGSGSIRVHDAETQFRVFSALGLTPAEAEERFGFLLRAFRYGAPPHGGFAIGMDRFTALLAGEENIREVIAFPKTQSGVDPLTGAPTPADPAALAALGLQLRPPRP
jgi:aspartyl-tRNA synthetase